VVLTAVSKMRKFSGKTPGIGQHSFRKDIGNEMTPFPGERWATDIRQRRQSCQSNAQVFEKNVRKRLETFENIRKRAKNVWKCAKKCVFLSTFFRVLARLIDSLPFRGQKKHYELRTKNSKLSRRPAQSFAQAEAKRKS